LGVSRRKVNVVPARRPPSDEDHREVIRISLGGIAADRNVFDIANDLAPLHPKNNTFPGEVLLELAADALEEAGASREDPIVYENIRERYLPECEFRGKHDHRASHYALTAAGMVRAGVQPDLLGEVAWWPGDDFWLFALYAFVIYIRVAGDRDGDGAAAVARRIAARRQVQLPG
jgi:hypothetical protein